MPLLYDSWLTAQYPNNGDDNKKLNVPDDNISCWQSCCHYDPLPRGMGHSPTDWITELQLAFISDPMVSVSLNHYCLISGAGKATVFEFIKCVFC